MKGSAWLLCLTLLTQHNVAAGPVEDNVTFAYAQVLRVSPAYIMVRISVPEERCDDLTESRDSGTGGAVPGELVGGALGNQVGKGGGRKASTLVGAVVGGVIGRGIDRNNGPRNPGCHTIEVLRPERRLDGYDVEYQYKGETYMSRLDHDPGNRLRIRIAVRPEVVPRRGR